MLENSKVGTAAKFCSPGARGMSPMYWKVPVFSRSYMHKNEPMTWRKLLIKLTQMCVFDFPLCCVFPQVMFYCAEESLKYAGIGVGANVEVTTGA